MSDVVATLGLNRKDFTEGLRAAEREGSAWARRMEGTFGSIQKGIGFGKLLLAGGALRMAFNTASGSVREFAKYNDGAKEAMQRFETGASRLKAAVGEVLTPAFDAATDAIDMFTGGLVSAAIAEEKSIASMKKLRTEIEAVKKAREDDLAFVKKLQTADEANFIESVRIAGDERRADTLAAGAPFRRQAEEIEADPNLTPHQKQQRLSTLDFFRRGAEDLVGMRFDASQQKERDETLRMLGADSEARAIELLRVNGRGGEARSAGIAMDSRMMIESVMRSALDQSSKAGWIARITQDTDKLLLAEAGADVQSASDEVQRLMAGGGSGASRSVGAGLSGAASMAAVFGAGGAMMAPMSDPMLKAQERLEKATREQTRILEAIKENTSRSPVAVAG